jgi:hypothetical protein
MYKITSHLIEEKREKKKKKKKGKNPHPNA